MDQFQGKRWPETGKLFDGPLRVYSEIRLHWNAHLAQGIAFDADGRYTLGTTPCRPRRRSSETLPAPTARLLRRGHRYRGRPQKIPTTGWLRHGSPPSMSWTQQHELLMTSPSSGTRPQRSQDEEESSRSNTMPARIILVIGTRPEP